MFNKRIEAEPYDKNGEARVKIASKERDLSDVMQPDMLEFWNKLDIDTDHYGYLLTNILGASEFWGSNLNGDAFPCYPEEEHPDKGLRRYYKTFEQAHVFFNHDNYSPELGVGKVLFASWNPIMMRVELLEQIDKTNKLGAKLMRNIEMGDLPKVSMGCRVQFDICSYCGNIAKNRSEYCEHLRHRMNEIMPDGTLICAINDHPRFFDSSKVKVEADRSSGTIMKVAQEAKDKAATMDKEVPAEESTSEEKEDPTGESQVITDEDKELEEEGDVLIKSDEDMDFPLLEALSKFPLHETLGTCTGLGIPVKPKEFMVIRITKSFGPKLGHYLYDNDYTIKPIFDGTCDNMKPVFNIVNDFNPKIAQVLEHITPQRSLFDDCVKARLKRSRLLGPREKCTQIHNDHKLACLYGRYLKDVKETHPLRIYSTMQKHAYSFVNLTEDDNSVLFKQADVKDTIGAIAKMLTRLSGTSLDYRR